MSIYLSARFDAVTPLEHVWHQQSRLGLLPLYDDDSRFSKIFPCVTACCTWQDALLDDVMLGFRLMEGLDLEAVASKYDCTAARRIERGVSEGLRHGWVIRDQFDDVGVGVGADVDDDVDVDGGSRSSGGCESVSSAKSIGGRRTADGHDSDGDTLGRLRVEVGGGNGGNGSEEGGGRGVESGGSANGGGLGRLRLSDPDGFLFSNSVISSVFCELDGWKRSRLETDS